MHRYVFYRLTDTPTEPEHYREAFHLRAVEVLKQIRGLYYEDFSTFGTCEQALGPTTHRTDPTGSDDQNPCYISVNADEHADFEPFENDLFASFMQAGITAARFGDALTSEHAWKPLSPGSGIPYDDRAVDA